jgi:hypothetical protein
MTGILQKASRRAVVIAQLQEALGLDLAVQARGDPELAELMRLEAIAVGVGNLVTQNNELIAHTVQATDLRAAIAQASDAEIARIPYVPERGIDRIRQWAGEEP